MNTVTYVSLPDPREWTDAHVRDWVSWAVNEFTLKGLDFQKFRMSGAALCALGKECFLELAPDFVGDILWEHLDILQKGNVYVMCVGHSAAAVIKSCWSESKFNN